MTIQDIDDKIKVLQTKLSVSNDSLEKQNIQRQISVMRFKREVETIKMKIQQLESN